MSNEKIGAMHWMYQQIMNDANISPAFKEALPVDLSVKLDGPTFARTCFELSGWPLTAEEERDCMAKLSEVERERLARDNRRLKGLNA